MDLIVDDSAWLATDAAIQAINDFSEPLAACATMFQETIQANFAAEGPGWTPLQPITLIWRGRRGYPAGPIEQQAGHLVDSYRKGGTGNLFFLTPNELMFGSTLPYADFQHTGGVTAHDSMIPGTTVPGRPAFTVNAALLANINRTFTVWFATKF